MFEYDPQSFVFDFRPDRTAGEKVIYLLMNKYEVKCVGKEED